MAPRKAILDVLFSYDLSIAGTKASEGSNQFCVSRSSHSDFD